MVNNAQTLDLWREVSGGVRGSRLLFFGALLLVAAALANVAGGLMRIYLPDSFVPVLKAAWLAWVGALWLVGAGFIWVGINPVLSRLGWVVGLLHVAQGLILLMTLFADIVVAVPNIALSLGRLLAIVIFAIFEKRFIGSRVAGPLIVAAMLLLAKIGAREASWLAALSEAWLTVIDGGMLVLLGWTLLRLAGEIRRCEDGWAEAQYHAKASGFNAFNNPEHPWNRD